MSKKTKRINSATSIRQWEANFRCPLCQSAMRVQELKSLICLAHNHTFDLTKQGYVNFIFQSQNGNYGKELFGARRKLIAETGFFAPLSQTLAEMISYEFSGTMAEESLTILDSGCGEGSHLSSICDQLKPRVKKAVTGVGLDISKEGIVMASKNHDEQIWLVADLANNPFKDHSFNVILNILSPANYSEFTRLIKDSGCVIKVVPQQDYLKELREFFYSGEEGQTYSNAQIVDRFSRSFQTVTRSSLRYTQALDQAALSLLVKMSPLTWASSQAKIEQFLNNEWMEITVALEILIGRNPT